MFKLKKLSFIFLLMITISVKIHSQTEQISNGETSLENNQETAVESVKPDSKLDTEADKPAPVETNANPTTNVVTSEDINKPIILKSYNQFPDDQYALILDPKYKSNAHKLCDFSFDYYKDFQNDKSKYQTPEQLKKILVDSSCKIYHLRLVHYMKFLNSSKDPLAISILQNQLDFIQNIPDDQLKASQRGTYLQQMANFDSSVKEQLMLAGSKAIKENPLRLIPAANIINEPFKSPLFYGLVAFLILFAGIIYLKKSKPKAKPKPTSKIKKS